MFSLCVYVCVCVKTGKFDKEHRKIKDILVVGHYSSGTVET